MKLLSVVCLVVSCALASAFGKDDVTPAPAPASCAASSNTTKDGSDGAFYCINGGTVGGTTGNCTCTGCDPGYEGTHCHLTQCSNTTHCNGYATSMRTHLEETGGCCVGCVSGTFLNTDAATCQVCSNAVCSKNAEHTPSAGATHQWSDFLTGVRKGTCGGDVDGYTCEQKVPSTAPNGGQDVKDVRNAGLADETGDGYRACYRTVDFAAGAANPNQASNVAACKAICDATGEAQACRVVAEANEICPEGWARKNGTGWPCQECLTDEDFRIYDGCFVECSHITCDAKTHTCDGQGLYHDTTLTNTNVTDIGPSTAFMRAKFGGVANSWDAVHSTAEDGCHPTFSIVTTHPKNHGFHFKPHHWEGKSLNDLEGDEFIGDTVVNTRNSSRYGLYEVKCTRGHKCSVGIVDGGQCKCRPTHKPLNYVAPGN